MKNKFLSLSAAASVLAVVMAVPAAIAAPGGGAQKNGDSYSDSSCYTYTDPYYGYTYCWESEWSYKSILTKSGNYHYWTDSSYSYIYDWLDGGYYESMGYTDGDGDSYSSSYSWHDNGAGVQKSNYDSESHFGPYESCYSSDYHYANGKVTKSTSSSSC